MSRRYLEKKPLMDLNSYSLTILSFLLIEALRSQGKILTARAIVLKGFKFLKNRHRKKPFRALEQALKNLMPIVGLKNKVVEIPENERENEANRQPKRKPITSTFEKSEKEDNENEIYESVKIPRYRYELLPYQISAFESLQIGMNWLLESAGQPGKNQPYYLKLVKEILDVAKGEKKCLAYKRKFEHTLKVLASRRLAYQSKTYFAKPSKYFRPENYRAYNIFNSKMKVVR
jgi:ribosomal protein S7